MIQNERVESIRVELGRLEDAFIRMMCVLLQPHEVEAKGRNGMIGYDWHLWVAIWSKYIYICIWVFPKIGVPQNGWFIMENPIKMDDLGVLFLETPIYI